MSQKLLGDARLYALIAHVDSEFAAETHAAGCGCGGKLHRANYPRQSRGGPKDLGEEWGLRFSFCCANDGCRKRATPPSVRFLGRRVYLGAVVVLLSAMTLGVTAKRAAELGKLVGVDVRTLERWRRWWRETFPVSRVWKAAKARFAPAVETKRLPASLLDRFNATDEYGGLVAVLELLAPLTTTSNSRSEMINPYPQRRRLGMS